MRRILFITFFLLLGAVSMTMSQTPYPGFTKISELEGIEEYKLDSNGLKVLLMEDHSAPVLTFMVTYLVGSRNEVTGNTGATHILEHMMFKGTETFNKRKNTSIFTTLQNIGAVINASTWLDRTNYFENIPSDKLELAVQIESDRMRNLLLLKEDLESEMTVVRNEFEQGENSPFQALDKEIWATAIQAHPYHHSTIGWRSDIENVPIEKLREFYNTFYWPNNATVTIIGDFSKPEALKLVNQYFGKIPSSPNPIPQLYTEEPAQNGPRRLSLTRAGELGIVGVAHKVPEGLHKDTYPITILNYILTRGKTSRLYKNIIDKGLATEVFVFYMPFHDKSLFIPYIFLTPGTKHEEVENILISEYEKIKSEGVSQEEVDRAIGQITAETAYKRDGSYSIASELNEAIAAGDWKFYVTFLDQIKKVTPNDVQEVAREYFNESQSTTGYFIPQNEGASVSDNDAAKPNEFMASHKKWFYSPEIIPNTAQTGTSISKNIERKKVNGIDVLTLKTETKDVVRIVGSIIAGDSFGPDDNRMVADLTGNMLDKGTTSLDKYMIAGKLESIGASIDFSVGTNTLSFSALCLKKDVPVVTELLAEQLIHPAFNKDELEKLKIQRKGQLKGTLEETGTKASETLSQMIFPKDHPNYDPGTELLLQDIDKVTIEQVKEFHRKYYGPKSMILVAVGDLDQNAFRQNIAEYFKGFSGGIDYPAVKKASPVNAATKVVPMKDKASVTLLLGNSTTLEKTDKTDDAGLFGDEPDDFEPLDDEQMPF